MRRHLMSAALILSLLPGVSSAGAPAKGQGGGGGEHLDLAPMGLPVIEGGRLKNYVFVQARLIAGPGADIMKLREKEPYYRDALVRAAHRASLTKAGDLTALDAARVEAVLLAEARRVSGPKSFSRAQLLKQTPRRRTGVSR